jgi:hypothetical protein
MDSARGSQHEALRDVGAQIVMPRWIPGEQLSIMDEQTYRSKLREKAAEMLMEETK